VCRPEGSIKLLGITTRTDVAEVSGRIRTIGLELRERDVFTTWSVLDRAGFEEGIVVGLQALGSAFFRPNIVFARLPPDASRIAELRRVVVEARRQGVAVLLLGVHEKAGLGRRQILNLWVRGYVAGASAEDALRGGESNLAILVAYRLHRAWAAELNVVIVVPDAAAEAGARAYVADLVDLSRLPRETATVVMTGALEDVVPRAPQADLDIVGLGPADELDVVRRMVQSTRSSCLFTVDSGNESALV
jgi:solute carrier family 12 sodium/potassium/chloride transporter 2